MCDNPQLSVDPEVVSCDPNSINMYRPGYYSFTVNNHPFAGPGRLGQKCDRDGIGVIPIYVIWRDHPDYPNQVIYVEVALLTL